MFKKFETLFCFIISAGRPPLGQMPFLVAPEGKILGQSGAIMKYICRKAGNPPPPGGRGVGGYSTDNNALWYPLQKLNL